MKKRITLLVIGVMAAFVVASFPIGVMAANEHAGDVGDPRGDNATGCSARGGPSYTIVTAWGEFYKGSCCLMPWIKHDDQYSEGVPIEIWEDNRPNCCKHGLEQDPDDPHDHPPMDEPGDTPATGQGCECGHYSGTNPSAYRSRGHS